MNRNLERMKTCPRFKRCSVPICPLDELKNERVYLKGEQKCSLSKNKRVKLGKDLPWKGLWPAEIAAIKRWENLSPEEQEQKREWARSHLSGARSKINLKND